MTTDQAALDLSSICFVRGATTILDDVSLRVERQQHWVVLGANGSGKSTLLSIAAMYQHPSDGEVSVLGERLGRVDVRTLRRRVGYSSAEFAGRFRHELTPTEVVMTAQYAALEPWWHRYTEADRRQARHCLDRLGIAELGDRQLASLSSGERQRVFLARTLMTDPDIIVLDEPAARLDLGGREQLVTALEELMANGPPIVMVTHHVEEIPPSITHGLLLSAGRVTASGPVNETLTAASLSACFSLPLGVERRSDGRWSAWSING